MNMKKALLFLLLVFALCLFMPPLGAHADDESPGEGNGTGDSQGANGVRDGQHGYSQSRMGVRVTVVGLGGQIVAGPVDFTNLFNPNPYGATAFIAYNRSKLHYRAGAGLSPSGYNFLQASPSLPPIMGNGTGVKEYFVKDYAADMVAKAVGMNVNVLMNGKYALLVEPVLYCLIRGVGYAITPTEAALMKENNYGVLYNGVVKHSRSFYLEYTCPFTGWSPPSASISLGLSGANDVQTVLDQYGMIMVYYKDPPPTTIPSTVDFEFRSGTEVIVYKDLQSGLGAPRKTFVRDDRRGASVDFIFSTGETITADEDDEYNKFVLKPGEDSRVWVKWKVPEVTAPTNVTITVEAWVVDEITGLRVQVPDADSGKVATGTVRARMRSLTEDECHPAITEEERRLRRRKQQIRAEARRGFQGMGEVGGAGGNGGNERRGT